MMLAKVIGKFFLFSWMMKTEEHFFIKDVILKPFFINRSMYLIKDSFSKTYIFGRFCVDAGLYFCLTTRSTF